MFFAIAKSNLRSAAWRISLWAALAFACGTLAAFVYLHRFVENDIQRRSEAWLSGEVGVLSDVANRTPKDRLYGRVIGEVAELSSREVPSRPRNGTGPNDAVFFILTAPDGSKLLWVGPGDGTAQMQAIQASKRIGEAPFDVQVRAKEAPFRVASVRLQDGGEVFLGLSQRDELRVLHKLRERFLLLWLLIVLLGFAIVFYSARRMLGDVREITEAASRIGESDLSQRVPTTERNDEVSQLAATLNRMLDRIQSSIEQLHTITDSLAHDLRSPLTAIRAKLEMSLSNGIELKDAEPIVAAIDELDRLSELLNKSLDVAEARADALRLRPTAIDLDELLRTMIHLYEPCLAERGIRVELSSAGAVEVLADAALMHRVVANLFDNEMKHLPASCTVRISLGASDDAAVLVVEDDGPGFESEVRVDPFRLGVKGRDSAGRGLGLAFVEAVVGAHGGSVQAANGVNGGARVRLELPLLRVEALVAG
jgi:signal transduction histidine kinase